MQVHCWRKRTEIHLPGLCIEIHASLQWKCKRDLWILSQQTPSSYCAHWPASCAGVGSNQLDWRRIPRQYTEALDLPLTNVQHRRLPIRGVLWQAIIQFCQCQVWDNARGRDWDSLERPKSIVWVLPRTRKSPLSPLLYAKKRWAERRCI